MQLQLNLVINRQLHTFWIPPVNHPIYYTIYYIFPIFTRKTCKCMESNM